MSILFEPTEINGLKLANRFVRSATYEGMAADDGACTPRLQALMVKLAEGQVGLIMTGHAYVLREGQAGPQQLGVYKDDLIPGLREMTAAVHDHGGKMVMQLAHAGFFAYAKLTGSQPMAPSEVEGLAKSPRTAMTSSDIQTVITAFADAAGRAQAAGFDGVQIHSAHGYLLSQFLSPIFNHRSDAYGGSIENRARIHQQVLQAVRKTVGPDYPVMIKINAQDFTEQGLSLEDSLAAARMIVGAGADAIELSGGLLNHPKLNPSRTGIKSPDQEAYFREEAKAYKKAIQVPLMLVGGNRSFHVAETLVSTGVADYISMCRPLIREPDLIKRWKAGDRRDAACVSDNLCFRAITKGNGVYCETEERERKRNTI